MWTLTLTQMQVQAPIQTPTKMEMMRIPNALSDKERCGVITNPNCAAELPFLAVEASCLTVA
jgi:hypothetical protein